MRTAAPPFCARCQCQSRSRSPSRWASPYEALRPICAAHWPQLLPVQAPRQQATAHQSSALLSCEQLAAGSLPGACALRELLEPSGRGRACVPCALFSPPPRTYWELRAGAKAQTRSPEPPPDMSSSRRPQAPPASATREREIFNLTS
jgi:hypothetical protein